MEHIGVQGVNPHLQRVLKSFQTTAMRSLQGPGPGIFQTLITDMAELEQYRKALAKKLPAEKGMEFDSLRAPPPFPVQQIPVLTPVDNGKSERIDTNLEEEKIACFVVGGEKRLCLPQILNTVLRDFSLQQINAVCDDLHIFCSRCNPEQLHILKITGVLPLSAPSCGLITKTDAERLCNALLHSSPEKYIEHPTKDSFKVYHECFGKCKGVFYPEIYSTPTGKCVQCCDCMGLFSPQTFVCHSHKALENRTCHWGFDSANWRSYLLLAKDQEGKEKLQEALERMKAKFDSNKNKRKQTTESSTCLKRSKSEESPGSSSSPGSWGENGEGRTMSAFRPWSPGMINAFKEGKGLPAPPAIMREGTNSIPPPYLQTGPPVLLNPERVVPHSESASYERGFAPNVSLAPPSHQKSSVCDTNEEEDEKERKTKILSSILDKQQSKEWELPSESDDSLHPSDGEECRSPEVKNLVETELDLIRRALDSTAKCSKDEKDNIIREFSKLRAQSEEYLQNTVQANRTLRQELTSQKLSTKEKVNKLCEENSKLEKEIEKIRIESECRMEKAEEDREKLMKEIKRLQTQEEAEATKYIQMNRELQARLHQFEMAYEQLYCDTIYLQEELQRHGIMLPEIISKQKFNGRYVGSKLSPRSPQLSPSGNSRSHAQSQTFCVKKERDT